MPKSRRLLHGLVSAVLLSQPLAARQAPQLPPDAERIIKEVTAAFEAWTAAYKRGDKQAFMSYLWKSEDFIALTRTGEIARGWESFRRSIEQDPLPSPAEFKIVAVLPLLPDNAVLTYTATDTGRQDTLKVTPGTMVWSRKPEGWRCVNFQFVRPEIPAVTVPSLPQVTVPTLPPVRPPR